MVDLLLESALRSLALGSAVWLCLTLLRVRNPRDQMTAWTAESRFPADRLAAGHKDRLNNKCFSWRVIARERASGEFGG